MLGRADEAKAVVAQALARFPELSIEARISGPSYLDVERARITEAMRKAGFPPCAKPEELAGSENPVRLPECEAERAKAAVSLAMAMRVM